MRPRASGPVRRHASALAVATAIVCLSSAENALAQTDAQRPPPQPAGVPKAPAETPTPPEAPPSKPSTAPAAAPDAKPPTVPPKAPPEAEDEEAPLPAPAPATPSASPPSAAGMSAMPLWPEPGADAAALERQGAERPAAKTSGAAGPDERVYAEDWWAHARPVIELHGYFRVRTQFFHRFNLGRRDPPGMAMWPRPTDDYYIDDSNGGQVWNRSARICTAEEAGVGSSDSVTSGVRAPCDKALQGGANIRFRVAPELHISDNLRILSQIDLLDNLVLGSTPAGTNSSPGSNGGYGVVARSGYAPIGFYEDTQAPPSSGRNALKDSIVVKRAWGEYASPVGELRFGRMPFQWGLGMMFNAGDGPDDDYQSTVDRIQAVTGIKPLDLYFSAAWDFPNEGVSSDSVALPNPEPYDLSQLDDVDQYVFSIARKKSPELERLSLARGDLVLNGGLQLIYRQQTIADDRSGSGTGCSGSAGIGCSLDQGNVDLLQYVRREATAWIPDLWFEARYKRFRFALEAVTVQGTIANMSTTSTEFDEDDEFKIASWGLATEIEQKLVDDKLTLGFKFGWASGDSDEDGLIPKDDPVVAQHGDHTFETFRFHPNYRIDMILNRNVLTRVQGSYYFRPNVDYDFMRDPNGQRIGGGVAAIWTRASNFIQAPGHERDLGIELNGRVYYQAKDGALNDLPGFLGGFYTELDYGVLFPMAGLGYPPRTAADISRQQGSEAADTRIAQTVRWYIGIMY